jgi:hypothetical protein
MSPSELILSRPNKLDHAQTVFYEIDMLRFVWDQLVSRPSPRGDKNEWVYLEAFLVHFRNLIEFFGKPKPTEGDLSVLRPADIWGDRIPTEDVLASMRRPDLWEKYETWDNEESISKYLHHCTIQRVVVKSWNVTAMYFDLNPILEEFQALLPQYKIAPPRDAVESSAIGALEGNSTVSTRILDWNLIDGSGQGF